MACDSSEYRVIKVLCRCSPLCDQDIKTFQIAYTHASVLLLLEITTYNLGYLVFEVIIYDNLYEVRLVVYVDRKN